MVLIKLFAFQKQNITVIIHFTLIALDLKIVSCFASFALLTMTIRCSLFPIWSWCVFVSFYHWHDIWDTLGWCRNIWLPGKDWVQLFWYIFCFILWMHSKGYNNHVFNNNKKDNANIFLLSNSVEWYKMQPMTKPSLYLMVIWTFTFKSDNFLIGFSIIGKTYSKL